MYEFKTELLETKVKLLNDSATKEDLEKLDNFIMQKQEEGWELVTYSYMVNTAGFKSAFAITFKRKK